MPTIVLILGNKRKYMKQQLFYFGFLLFGAVSCTPRSSQSIPSEQIIGEANVRDSIKGNVLFTLNDKTFVLSKNLDKRWYEIATVIRLNREQLIRHSIYSGEILYDTNGNSIGIAVRNIVPIKTDSTATLYYGVFTGFTHMNNLNQETFPEVVVTKYIKEAKNNSYSAYKKLLAFYPFTEVRDPTGLHVFSIYENSFIHPTPRYRLVLVFDNSYLAAVIHLRTIEVPNAIDINLEKGYRCYLLGSVTNKQEFVEKLNRFIELSNRN